MGQMFIANMFAIGWKTKQSNGQMSNMPTSTKQKYSSYGEC